MVKENTVKRLNNNLSHDHKVTFSTENTVRDISKVLSDISYITSLIAYNRY